MRVAMISPSQETEKAISTLSLDLVKGIRKKGLSIDFLGYSAGSPLSFLNLFKKLKFYDIIHLQYEYNLLGYYGVPFYLILPLLKLTGKRIIFTMHTVLSKKEKFYDSKIKSFFRKALYTSQNWLINNTSKGITVNENFYKEVLTKDYGISSKKIKVIHQPVVEKPPLINKSKAKKYLSLSGNVYLIIGNLTQDNGADIIIRQADKIGKTILFVTNPRGVNTRNKRRIKEYIQLNKEIVKRNNSGKFVRFDLKEIPYNLWWKYFSAADLILQAYRGGIRSGVFSDAMASKTPVISSDILFFREMAKKYDSLKIAKSENDYPELIKKALKPKNYRKMVKECEGYIKENSLSVISQKYKEFYNSFCN